LGLVLQVRRIKNVVFSIAPEWAIKIAARATSAGFASNVISNVRSKGRRSPSLIQIYYFYQLTQMDVLYGQEYLPRAAL